MGMIDNATLQIAQKTPSIRSNFAARFMAAILANSNSRGVLPNAEMIAEEAVKYADALILKLSSK